MFFLFMASSDPWTRFSERFHGSCYRSTKRSRDAWLEHQKPGGYPSIGYFMGILCRRREILESTATWKLRIRDEFFARIASLPTLFQLGFYRRNVMKAFFPPLHPPHSHSPLPLDFLIYRRRIYRFCFLSFKVADHLLISLLRQVFCTRSST